MSSEFTIKVEGISKNYHIYDKPHHRLLQMLHVGKKSYYRDFWALKDISFNIKKGETVGILGRNGSGKSTLLQIIAGTLSPTTGSVQTNGMLAALLELGSGFNPDFTGRENVYLNGAILGFDQEMMDTRFDEIAAFADIGEHLDQPVKTYSSGMYVRLAFAVQACVKPDILIVDEALSVGDEKFQRKCFNYIECLRADGCAVLMVTHSTATVEKFCQRGVLLHGGEVHGIGSAKEIVDQYHALLYSDEKAYLRYLNTSGNLKTPVTAKKVQTYGLQAEIVNHTGGISNKVASSTHGELRAVITCWEVIDIHDEPAESFKTGEFMTIRFDVDVFDHIKEIQGGILMRTVEGVSAFGTSTDYHAKNYQNAVPGTRLQFTFNLRLTLFPGAYFITLAIAETDANSGSMSYLDRKTDAIVVKVEQLQALGSGIAALETQVAVTNKGKE